MKHALTRVTALLLSPFAALHAADKPADRPNIILILADDLGYGDLGCYGATALKTPNLDRLAKQGLRFTDAHSTSATCTPSRYSLLTGEYAWRRKGTGILPGNAALIIEPGRTTLPSILQKSGYRTGVVGKWHLGLGNGNINWNGEIKPGPQEIGFDDEFIMAATGDRVPCVFVENRRVVGLDPNDPIRVNYKTNFPGEPTGKDNPELLKMHPSYGHDQAIVNGISRIGYMTGGKTALWKDEDMSDTFLGKAVAFIETHRSRPFFLYYATHEPHVPRVPHPRFVGKSGLGPRGDAILQLDASVGTILETLDRLKLADNTLIIFSSDNGPVLADGYQDQAQELNGAHRPAGPLRGTKYSSYEAGTRVPFIVSWPARIKPGVSDALVCQVDLLASLAALTGQSFDTGTAPDTQNYLAAFLGESPTARQDLAEQGGPMALRDGAWKFIPPTKDQETNTRNGSAPEPQLFNLAEDLGEKNNRAATQSERTQKMAAQLETIRKPQPGVSSFSFTQTADVLCKIADNVIEQTVFELPAAADSPQPGRFNAWEYQNYMILEGMNSLHQATGNEKYGSYAARNVDFFISFQQKFGDTMLSTPAGLKKWYSEPKTMWQCGMIAAFPERQKINPDKELERGMATFDTFLEKAPKLADGTLARMKGQNLGLGVQIDDLYMVVPYWCRKSKWLGNTACLERAITESLNYHTYLWNENDRLMKCLWLDKNKSTCGLYWGRGNAWYGMALTDLLTFIPADHPKRAAVLENYRRFIQGIVSRQDADGLWHQLLDQPDSFSESSCSGMFTYCILKGVNEGWLDPRLLEAGNKGWAGLLTKVNASFQITDVCPGTDISEDPDYYLNRRVTNDQHAIGPFLLAGAEYLKANKLLHGTR